MIIDPRPVLLILTRTQQAGKAPRATVPWIQNASRWANDIIETVENKPEWSRKPSERQMEVLQNIYREACEKLGRTPDDDECRSEGVPEPRFDRDQPVELSINSGKLARAKGAPRIVKRFPKM